MVVVLTNIVDDASIDSKVLSTIRHIEALVLE
jgi:hypothetical protein